MPYAALAILAASLVSLATAFTLQQVFDIQPCILCLFQRIPYAVSLILAALALIFRNKPCAVKFLLVLCALSFLANSGISTFHSGVERHWWAGTNNCAVTPLNGKTAMTTADLLSTAVSQCDEINFSIFGVTLANVNVFFCLGLALLALMTAFGCVPQKEEESCSCCSKE